jgi:hypothetical protein
VLSTCHATQFLRGNCPLTASHTPKYAQFGILGAVLRQQVPGGGHLRGVRSRLQYVRKALRQCARGFLSYLLRIEISISVNLSTLLPTVTFQTNRRNQLLQQATDTCNKTCNKQPIHATRPATSNRYMQQDLQQATDTCNKTCNKQSIHATRPVPCKNEKARVGSDLSLPVVFIDIANYMRDEPKDTCEKVPGLWRARLSMLDLFLASTGYNSQFRVGATWQSVCDSVLVPQYAHMHRHCTRTVQRAREHCATIQHTTIQ